MKKVLFTMLVLVLAIGLAIPMATPVAAHTESDPQVQTLYAGQNIDVGTVNVWNDDTSLYVTYEITAPDWIITETHLYVGKNPPPTSAPGQFPYDDSDATSATDTMVTYEIPLSNIDSYSMQLNKNGKPTGVMISDGSAGVVPCNNVCIAAHSDVHKESGNILTNPGAEEGDITGWDSATGGVAARQVVNEWTGPVEPYAGDWFFVVDGYQMDSIMTQEIDVSGWGGASFYAGGHIQTELLFETEPILTNNDYGELIVSFYDALDNPAGSFSTGNIGNPVRGDAYVGADGYSTFGIVDVMVPEQAVTAIYEVKGFWGDLVSGNNWTNVYYDDLAFEMEDEETAWSDGNTYGTNWAMYFTYHIQSILLGDWALQFVWEKPFPATYDHGMTIDTQNADGTFSGTGGYPLGGPYSKTWTVSGDIEDSMIILYDPPSTYVATLIIENADSDSMNGTFTGTGPNFPSGTWTATRIP